MKCCNLTSIPRFPTSPTCRSSRLPPPIPSTTLFHLLPTSFSKSFFHLTPSPSLPHPSLSMLLSLPPCLTPSPSFVHCLSCFLALFFPLLASLSCIK
ncbi:hypothetical protein N431DRAFT_226555 [Stipitochalara longipes BDJ]|nr:hypothetical protein N431DRAFT_226555 [Stipitochalara longipes BDJ]